MAKKIMINNLTDYPMEMIHEYLGGYLQALIGLVMVHTEAGKYYDVITVKEI